MNCEKCSKNHATYHLTAIENNKKTEAHLCEECARGAGVGFKFGPSITDLLGKTPAQQVGTATNPKCGRCGMTFKKFRETGRFGCADDYEVFREELMKVLHQIHGSNTHVGKVPGGAKGPDRRALLEVDLIKFKKELDEVVKSENYEKAAELRDKIKNIEKELAG